MEVKSILCDAATVREGLLHILGGGITRLFRDNYPAPFTGGLAVVIHPHHSEVGLEHQIVIQVATQDGEIIGKLDGTFRVDQGEGTEPGEQSVVPIVLDFSDPPLIIPAQGGYSVDVLVDKQHKDSLTFFAKTRPSA